MAACSFGAVLAVAGEPDWAQDPNTGCGFVVPRSLTAGETHWTGACLGGRAGGPGMLRRRDGAVAGPAFFGDMRDGVPVIGVIDLDGGYLAGPFADGDIGRGEVEPQARIDAFDAAARAARAVSAAYAAQKNDASARHYETVAATLEMQIE